MNSLHPLYARGRKLFVVDARFRVMLTTYVKRETRAAGKVYAPPVYSVKRRRWDWCMLGAIAGLSGGIMAVLIGSLLTVGSWLTGGGSSYLRTLGTIFLSLTIPLLICGAHGLDLMERRKDRERETRFRDQS